MKDRKGILILPAAALSFGMFCLIVAGDIQTVPGIKIRKLAHDEIGQGILVLTYICALVTLLASRARTRTKSETKYFWLVFVSCYLGASCFLNGGGVTINGLPAYIVVIPALLMLGISLILRAKSTQS